MELKTPLERSRFELISIFLVSPSMSGVVDNSEWGQFAPIDCIRPCEMKDLCAGRRSRSAFIVVFRNAALWNVFKATEEPHASFQSFFPLLLLSFPNLPSLSFDMRAALLMEGLFLLVSLAPPPHDAFDRTQVFLLTWTDAINWSDGSQLQVI